MTAAQMPHNGRATHARGRRGRTRYNGTQAGSLVVKRADGSVHVEPAYTPDQLGRVVAHGRTKGRGPRAPDS